MARLDPTQKTRIRLYALSGNRCAFPGCVVTFVSPEDETNISNICHIEAAEVGGERYNPNSNDEERRDFKNLILLCRNHHAVTNDVNVYTVDVLRKMKQEHEDKIRKLLSEKDVLNKHNSALNYVINIVGKTIFETEQNTEPQSAPNPDEKITYNNVIRYKPIIQAYSVYQGKLNKIYEAIEKQGSFKKDNLLRNINLFYLKEKGKYQTVDIIRQNADNIIENIENEMWNIINNSSNEVKLDYETISMSVLVVLVDAFMRCNILEEP
jgi:hypothetical protein